MRIQQENDRGLRECVEKALKLELGITIEIQGTLYIRDLDNGVICVGGSYGPHMENFVVPKEGEVWPTWEKEFSSLNEAIKFFLNYRNEHKLGGDFEVFSGN